MVGSWDQVGFSHVEGVHEVSTEEEMGGESPWWGCLQGVMWGGGSIMRHMGGHMEVGLFIGLQVEVCSWVVQGVSCNSS